MRVGNSGGRGRDGGGGGSQGVKDKNHGGIRGGTKRKIFSVEGQDGVKLGYRVWNPFRFKLVAGFLDGIDHIYIVLKSKVLYLGTASVGFSSRSGFDLVNIAKKGQCYIITTIEDS
ncbi:6279_t:CDS:2 [Entrophospora sp. SA101]|nr:6279_t:CDS:2 [Entrophospora sp. SA101]